MKKILATVAVPAIASALTLVPATANAVGSMSKTSWDGVARGDTLSSIESGCGCAGTVLNRFTTRWGADHELVAFAGGQGFVEFNVWKVNGVAHAVHQKMWRSSGVAVTVVKLVR